MTDATLAPVPPAAPAPQVQRGLGIRTYLLAGCSIGGTLCASLAANAEVNLVFVLASAIFGAVIVLLTAAPSVVSPAAVISPQAAATPAGTPASVSVTAVPTTQPGLGGAVGIGILAGVLSFIMNQIAQVGVGFVAFNLLTGELTADQMIYVTTFIGIGVLIVKTPFDVFVGAFHLSRARNLFAALGIFALTYLFCYFIEQMISAAMGASGLFTTITNFGLEGLMWGMFYVIGVPTIAQAVGAFGVRLAAMLPRRRASG